MSYDFVSAYSVQVVQQVLAKPSTPEVKHFLFFLNIIH